MKRTVLVLILLGLFVSFVSAVGEPSLGVGAEDAEKLQDGIDKYSPLDESGQVDYRKYQPFVTKAEMRIDAVNLWLEENASWLKVVFGMVPSLTWLFVFNLWIWLWFLVFFVLNSDVTLGWVPFLTERKIIAPGTFHIRKDKVFGVGLLVVAVILKFNVYLAQIALNLFDVVWNYVVPIGVAALVILAILIVLGLIFFFPITMSILKMIHEAIKAHKEKKAKERQDLNREVLERVASGVTRDEY